MNKYKNKPPAIVNAVTISGEATKAWVAGLASLRPINLKFEISYK